MASAGFVNNLDYVGNADGVRLVVSLGDGAVITEGDGSEESPFVVLDS